MMRNEKVLEGCRKTLDELHVKEDEELREAVFDTYIDMEDSTYWCEKLKEIKESKAYKEDGPAYEANTADSEKVLKYLSNKWNQRNAGKNEWGLNMEYSDVDIDREVQEMAKYGLNPYKVAKTVYEGVCDDMLREKVKEEEYVDKCVKGNKCYEKYIERQILRYKCSEVAVMVRWAEKRKVLNWDMVYFASRIMAICNNSNMIFLSVIMSDVVKKNKKFKEETRKFMKENNWH